MSCSAVTCCLLILYLRVHLSSHSRIQTQLFIIRSLCICSHKASGGLCKSSAALTQVPVCTDAEEGKSLYGGLERGGQEDRYMKRT